MRMQLRGSVYRDHDCLSLSFGLLSMILGRLEMMSFLAIFSFSYWRE
jgi:hypothetical protein